MGDQDSGGAMTPIRVVIVDDAAEVRFLLATILEMDGRFEVVGEADRAKGGVSAVGETRPDLVLVDLHLGRRDGIWLLRELRNRHPHLPLAVVTGSPSQKAHRAALRAGADSVHNKVSMTTTMVGDLLACVEGRMAAAAGLRSKAAEQVA